MARNESEEKKKVKPGKEHLILCEGKDEWSFLVTYLNSPALSDIPKLSTVIQVEDFGGNSNLKKQLELWTKAPGFDGLKSLIVVRDAETNAEGAQQSIIHAFGAANLPQPSSPCQLMQSDSLTTGFILFPACNNTLTNGTLEDLCLSILEDTDNQALQEINSFLAGIKEKGLRTFPREFKTKVHTYLSITDKYVSLKIGEAAKAGAFDWTSNKLQSLRDFFINMVKQSD